MSNALHDAIAAEVLSAFEASGRGDYDHAFRHLECAHLIEIEADKSCDQVETCSSQRPNHCGFNWSTQRARFRRPNSNSLSNRY
jgi:hypothetical protein